MSLNSTPFRNAIYSKLNDDATLSGLITGVYDDVPEGTAYPYVVIGDDTAVNSGSKTIDGNEHTLNIHVWSRYRGKKEAVEIMERIYTLLHNVDISLSGASLINIRQEFNTVLVDADGITRHGIIRFRAVVFDED